MGVFSLSPEMAGQAASRKPEAKPFSTEIVESPDGTVTVRHAGYGKVEVDGQPVTKDALVKWVKCPNCGCQLDADGDGQIDDGADVTAGGYYD